MRNLSSASCAGRESFAPRVHFRANIQGLMGMPALHLRKRLPCLYMLLNPIAIDYYTPTLTCVFI